MKKILVTGHAPAGEQPYISRASSQAIVLINNIDDIRGISMKGYDIIYVSGNLLSDHALTLALLKAADEVGMEIALDMFSQHLVMQERDFFRQILTDYIDIVFASKDEAMAYAFAGGDVSCITDPALTAAVILGRTCRVAVVKLGADGIVYHNNAHEGHCPAEEAKDTIETIVGAALPDAVWEKFRIKNTLK